MQEEIKSDLLLARLVKVGVLKGLTDDLHVVSSGGDCDVVQRVGELFNVVALLDFVDLLFVLALVTKLFVNFAFFLFF